MADGSACDGIRDRDRESLTRSLSSSVDVDTVLRAARQLMALTDQAALDWELESHTSAVMTLLFSSTNRMALGVAEFKQLCENMSVAEACARPDGVRLTVWRPSWLLTQRDRACPAREQVELLSYRAVDPVQALPDVLTPADRTTMMRLVHRACNMHSIQHVPVLRVCTEEGRAPLAAFEGFEVLDVFHVERVFKTMCTQLSSMRVVVENDALVLEATLARDAVPAPSRKRARAFGGFVRALTRARTGDE